MLPPSHHQGQLSLLLSLQPAFITTKTTSAAPPPAAPADIDSRLIQTANSTSTSISTSREMSFYSSTAAVIVLSDGTVSVFELPH
jgi:hypothetical protein